MTRKLFLWFSLISFISYSQDIYEIDTTYPVHDLMNHLKIVEDQDENLTPDEQKLVEMLDKIRLYVVINSVLTMLWLAFTVGFFVFF